VAEIIYLVRHAEKPVAPGPPYGVDADGNQDGESLTPRGWQRAGALVNLFAGSAASSSTGPRESRAGSSLVTPAHLFASQVGPGSSSKRPLQTLEPLAARLGLQVDVRFLKPQLADLAAAARTADGIALISWEHRLIPQLATMILGNPAGIPQTWPDDRFDLVWACDVAHRTLHQIPEMLLAGDRPDPFPL
jgi:broad specificity phosphatase PhoE